ncbi:MAG: aminotransferase class V-fold PLP-dependent enzyme [Candidatus Eremiobacteraeota bacterium]|nr:aminotransferase class V-fold PLP-dependent enzyme [Candidatus Eremiobacteraeota bacterium]
MRETIARDEIRRWRAETPGCANVVHFNNAGAGLMPGRVLDVMKTHLDAEAFQGGYEAANAAAARIEAAREAVATLCSTAARNLAIVESATAGINLVLGSIDWKRGDRIVTTRNDYASNQIMMLSLQRRFGIEVVRSDDLPEGGADPASFERLLEMPAVRLALVTWVPTNSGLVQPVEALGAACAAADIPYAIDACQAVGQIPIDVERLRCDFLTASARKFLRGPRGIGFLYASDRALECGSAPVFPDMRGADWTSAETYELKPDARRFEYWEYAYALVLGLGEAARYAMELGIDRTSARAHALAARLRSMLGAIPGVRVLDRGARLSAIVSLAVDGAEPADVTEALRANGINASWTNRTSATIDLDDKGVAGIVRLSPHYYNTDEELERAAGCIAAMRSRSAAT